MAKIEINAETFYTRLEKISELWTKECESSGEKPLVILRGLHDENNAPEYSQPHSSLLQ